MLFFLFEWIDVIISVVHGLMSLYKNTKDISTWLILPHYVFLLFSTLLSPIFKP